MPIIMILVDGIGIAPVGVSDPVRGASHLMRSLHPEHPIALPGDGWAVPTRADLDTPGLPQSATGHTALITGINAARVLGRHFPGFPPPTLRSLIESNNILSRLNEAGLRADYVNAFRPTLNPVKSRKLMSATTIAAKSCGQRIRGLEDIPSGRALHHDFTNLLLIEQGENLPLFTPRQAGRSLARMADGLDLVFYEYFLTDLAGHSKDPWRAQFESEKIDVFLRGVLEEIDLRHNHVIVCSDHGNMEDPSVRTHTKNPVPTLLWGPRSMDTASRIRSIQDIPHELFRLLFNENGSAT